MKYSPEDADLFVMRTWSYNTGYATATIDGKTEYFHRLVATRMYGEIPDGIDVDHVDGDRLNNRRDNIILLTHSDNLLKGVQKRNNTSGHRGVTWTKREQRWRARCTSKQCSSYGELGLGYYKNFDDAVEAREDHMFAVHGILEDD